MATDTSLKRGMPTEIDCRAQAAAVASMTTGYGKLMPGGGASDVGAVPDNHAGLAEVLGLSELVLIPAEGGLATNWAPCRGHGPLGRASQDLYHKDRPIERCLP
jgi:hypothetical protein